jgi:hypothetical protein
MRASHPMTIEGLTGPDGPTLCRAAVLDSRHLAVELEGSPALIRHAALQMLHGSMDVEYRGIRLVLTHFTVFNQGRNNRLIFQAAHRPR